MTALADILVRQIALTGPITLADYMAACLLHPQHGYYTTHDPFGVAGDFTTAPEISQMFGELLGLCVAQAWLDQGKPAPFTLVELGPGRGTLMADVVRATALVPGFHAGMRIHLVEKSPTLRRLQKQTLTGFSITWVDDVWALPDAPLYLLANEFFDALPIRQFTRMSDGWAETMVDVVDATLTMGRGAAYSLPLLEHRVADTVVGDVVEFCPAVHGIIEKIAATIALHGGAALIADYGDWGSKGDTFQAVRNQAYADPLAEPGLADLTAHVDFAALAFAAKRVRHTFAAQGAFLIQLGIAARTARLAKGLTGDALTSHLAAARRLTSPSEMGQLFKVLALAPQGGPPIPGIA
jgi:NADH dehydrogenase [ubiquinone] 1 alpha subcomplex assembly factor 7